MKIMFLRMCPEITLKIKNLPAMASETNLSHLLSNPLKSSFRRKNRKEE
jgi:hypothetical protein